MDVLPTERATKGLAKAGAGRKAVRVALLLSLALTAPASAMPAEPALVGAPSGTSVVDTTVDGVDAVRDGICATASGECTLGAASDVSAAVHDDVGALIAGVSGWT
jgi:hypothetical protein